MFKNMYVITALGSKLSTLSLLFTCCECCILCHSVLPSLFLSLFLERDPLVDQNLFSHFTQFLEVSVLFFTELLIITTTIIIYSLIKIKSSVYGCGWGNKGLPLMHEF